MLFTLLFAACALEAAAFPTAPSALNAGTKITLPRRSSLTNADGSANAAAILRHFNHTLLKYKAPRMLPSFDLGDVEDSFSDNVADNFWEKRGNNLALSDQVEDGEDELYYGPGTVGATDPQTFTFDFDTGSADLFVPGPKCGAAEGCLASSPHYSQTGTDEGNTTSVTYGSGEVTGENYLDSVSIAGLTATQQNVISLTKAEGFNTSDSNSLLGMGFSTIAESKKPTFFESLISQGKVSTPEFSFYLGRKASGTQGASELTLGGRDSSKYTGAVTKVPVTTKGYWQVALDKVDVSGSFFSSFGAGLTQGEAAIDTGTTIIVAPTLAAEAIFSSIPGAFPLTLSSQSSSEALYAYPCDSDATVSLVFAGRSFAISSLDMSLGEVTEDMVVDAMGPDSLSDTWDSLTSAFSGSSCVAAIAGADIDPEENLYIVGDSFLKSWYSIYNYENSDGGPSVSFAKAVTK